MPTALRNRNAALLFKIESVEGTEQVPSNSADGVRVEVSGSPITYSPALTQTNEVSGSLDPQAPIVGGVQVAVRFSVWLKGSGSAATAPEVGQLLRACGWAETITATAVPPSAAAAASGTTTSITLGAAASTTAQAYRGMPIDITGTGGDVGTPFCTDYTAGKVATLSDLSSVAWGATNNQQVLANVRYAPSSAAAPSGTLYWYRDGVLEKVVGCRGSFVLVMTAAGAARLDFTMTGIYLSKTDAAVPTVTYQSTIPPIWRAGKMLFNRIAAPVSTFQIDGGNVLVYGPDPNRAQGFAPGIITERRITGQFDRNATLVADGDPLADMVAATLRIVHARYGTVAGNRIGVTVPAAQLTQANPGDRQGVAADQIQLFASGADAGAFLCFY